MDDLIPFKVFAYWKEGEKPEVRRFGVDKTVVTSYHYMNAKIQEVYPGLKGKSYNLTWKDDDDDDVVISSDDELMLALQSLTGDVLRLNVICKEATAKEDDCNIVFAAVTENAGVPATGSTSGLHYGVQCDGCDRPVVGFRYKCTSCDDYDLCSTCEAAGLHPEHCMVRVPTPDLPRTVIRAAIKRSRHFLKTVATHVGEGCPYKKNRRDRSGERKHRGSHGPHGHGPHGHRSHAERDEHHRRYRSSWIDTIATYMNEFANLAGDFDVEPKKPEATAQGQPDQVPQAPKETQEKPKTTTESTTANEPQATPQQPAGCYREVNVPELFNVDRIKKFLELAVGTQAAEDILQGNFNTLAQAMVPPNTPAAPSTPAAPTAPVDTDVEMGQGDRKPMEAEKVIKSESANTTDETPRDLSPERVDGWTVINKENDLANTPTAPNEVAAPIGFNLPQEFQERVKISEGGLYPPLNTSTAVLNPKEAELPRPLEPTKAAPPKPASTTSEAKPTAPPQRQRHPKPHIEAAIQQMLSMGFTNDGGWLTQLLESKDGNIAAVLDLLTPVAPKK